MPEEKREFATLRVTGPRFDDHGLDIDVLPELISYKRLLIETAQEIWRRRNPERQRLPKGFEANVVIKFFRLQPGSTEVPLVRQVEKCQASLLPLFDEQPDEIDEAAIDAAGSGRSAPETLLRSVIPFFREFGQTLREDEAIIIRAGPRGNVARYDGQVRERVLLWGEQVYKDMIDLSGEVRSTDLDRCSFALKLDDGRKVAGQYALPSKND
jgi:hypothetical protein